MSGGSGKGRGGNQGGAKRQAGAEPDASKTRLAVIVVPIAVALIGTVGLVATAQIDKGGGQQPQGAAPPTSVTPTLSSAGTTVAETPAASMSSIANAASPSPAAAADLEKPGRVTNVGYDLVIYLEDGVVESGNKVIDWKDHTGDTGEEWELEATGLEAPGGDSPLYAVVNYTDPNEAMAVGAGSTAVTLQTFTETGGDTWWFERVDTVGVQIHNGALDDCLTAQALSSGDTIAADLTMNQCSTGDAAQEWILPSAWGDAAITG